MTEQEIYNAAEQKVGEWATSRGFEYAHEGHHFREYTKKANGVNFQCVVLMNNNELDQCTRIFLEANTLNEDIDVGSTIKDEKDLEHIGDLFDRWEKLCISYLRTVL